MTNIEEVTKCIWDLRVKSSVYNPIDGIVEIEVEDINEYHKIVFKNVSFYLYIQNYENKFNAEDKYKELSSIIFESESINLKETSQKWLKEYSLDFNVSLEFIASLVLIKCEEMYLDDVTYEIQGKS